MNQLKRAWLVWRLDVWSYRLEVIRAAQWSRLSFDANFQPADLGEMRALSKLVAIHKKLELLTH